MTGTSLEYTPGRDYFVQDPAFPMRLHRAGVARATDFLQFAFAGYSRRGITVLTDRKKAIGGILTRMQKSFRDPGPYGVFEFGLYRLLLWFRSDPSTSRIIYGSQDQVPHWSWMAYPGEIKCLVGVNHKLNPVCAKDLYLDERGLKLTGKVRKFQRCQIGRDGSISDGYVKVGSTALDTIQNRSCDGAVVIARSGSSELKPDDYLFLLLV
ncbi:hypothetical protein QSH57_003067 [Fusarium oxysporum f. sp. vasinfectum]|nr:hypothetical protein QSH57_003067 [Fusarium oxysporum f. sp. vasinfectum]